MQFKVNLKRYDLLKSKQMQGASSKSLLLYMFQFLILFINVTYIDTASNNEQQTDITNIISTELVTYIRGDTCVRFSNVTGYLLYVPDVGLVEAETCWR
jgi:hypothetical protein